MLYLVGVIPHFFQLIKLPVFLLKNMYNYINIIYKHPLQRLVPFMPVRQFFTFLLYFFLYGICYGFYLNIAGGFANNKKVCYRFLHLSQVQGYYIFTFFIPDSVDDRFKKLAVPRQPGCTFGAFS